MRFGVRAAESTKSSNTGSGDWLRYFKDVETPIRFLQEIDDWTEVWLHFSPGKSRRYPCTGERDACPGCLSENERESKASKVYITNALTEGYVNAWIIPGGLRFDMDRYSDKGGGTILDRDFTVVRRNEENMVRYSVERGDRDQIDLSPYQSKLKDHQKMLMDAYVEVWGAEPGEKVTEREVIAKAPITVLKQTPENEVKGSWGDNLGDPPSEPQAQQDPGAEEDQELSESQLRAMSAPQIKALFRQCGLVVPETDNTEALADYLMASLA